MEAGFRKLSSKQTSISIITLRNETKLPKRTMTRTINDRKLVTKPVLIVYTDIRLITESVLCHVRPRGCSIRPMNSFSRCFHHCRWIRTFGIRSADVATRDTWTRQSQCPLLPESHAVNNKFDRQLKPIGHTHLTSEPRHDEPRTFLNHNFELK